VKAFIMQRYGPTDDASAANPPQEPRPLVQSILRGLKGRCPHCGEGRLFARFLKPVDRCAACGEDMHHQRADDLPPYLSIFIVGHIVVAGYMIGETATELTSWQHLAIWVPITLALTFAMMQPLKGGVIGLQWALRMHGFGGEKEDPHMDAIDDVSPAHDRLR
jgi:uncharacterized protein (DUF983 family)